MKKRLSQVVFVSVLLCIPIFFTACMDDFKEKLKSVQGKATKVIYPVPNCSDNEIIVAVNKSLTKDALYGTQAQVKYGTILLTGTEAGTEAKTCEAVVTYSIDKDDNEISSFLSKIPLVKNVSKDRTISYSITRNKDQENFSVHVH